MKKYMRCGSCGNAWPTMKAGAPKSKCAKGHDKERMKWVVEVKVDGKRRRSSFPTEQAAKIAIAEMAVAEATTGEVIPPQRKPFGQYLSEWIESRESSLSANSIAAYRRAGNKVGTDAIGRIAISALTRADLRSFYARLLAGGLAPSSIGQVAAVIGGATAEAQAAGHSRTNPGYKSWVVPKDATLAAPAVRKVFTASEMKTLMPVLEADELWPLWRFIAATAVRRGEALGLQWDDIDTATRTVTVSRNMVKAPASGATPTIGSTKSGHRRTIPLDSKTYDILMAWRRDQKKRQLQAYAWTTQGWVFDRGGGVAWNPSTISSRFAALARDGEVPALGIHALRHTALSQLSKQLPMEVVSKLAGHSNVAITSAVYSHMDPDTLADATARIAEALDA